jgi:hypothetical protein
VISDTELRDVRPDRSHDPRDLVTQHRRRRHEIVSGEQQVGVTEPGCSHVDENFAPDRHGNVHVLEIKPATDRVEHKCLHGWRPPARMAVSRWQCRVVRIDTSKTFL